MITLFIILLLVFLFKVIFGAIKLAWSITKVIVNIILFPLVLVLLVAFGLTSVAIIALIIGLIISFFLK